MLGQHFSTAWSPELAGELKSVLAGRQWCQTMHCRVRADTTDPRCQLCLAAEGNFEHRPDCTVTKPPGGWPDLCGGPDVNDLSKYALGKAHLQRMPEAQRKLLSIHGVMAFKTCRWKER